MRLCAGQAVLGLGATFSMEVALEVALYNPIVRWTLLGQAGGLAVCRGWRKHATTSVVFEPALAATMCRRLSTRHTMGLPLPPLLLLPPLWRAEQRLRLLESEIVMQTEDVLLVEVTTGVDDLWANFQPFQPIPSATRMRAMAVAKPGSTDAVTTQMTVSEDILTIDETSSAQPEVGQFRRLPLGDLWLSWLRQFRELQLPLQERPPFRLQMVHGGGQAGGAPPPGCSAGSVLCDLRMRHGENGWANLRVTSFIPSDPASFSFSGNPNHE